MTDAASLREIPLFAMLPVLARRLFVAMQQWLPAVALDISSAA